MKIAKKFMTLALATALGVGSVSYTHLVSSYRSIRNAADSQEGMIGCP